MWLFNVEIRKIRQLFNVPLSRKNIFFVQSVEEGGVGGGGGGGVHHYKGLAWRVWEGFL